MGVVSVGILYLISKKFEVRDHPKMAEILALLPAANCGGCGHPGCSGFAAACIQATTLEGLSCPAGGAEVMSRIAAILGREAAVCEPAIAVVRCHGNCANRTRTNRYDGVNSCTLVSALYGGETDCAYGCLGGGNCVAACLFHAIRINPQTQLPEVSETLCTACGACVKACPKQLIQLRKKGPDSHRIYVGCRNKDKGAAARKACNVACIGCSKCLKSCESQAIILADNLAFIDDSKCTLCGKCASECPTAAIIEHLNA
jgi:Na+-translocating ferredoxin:NAD+ oxidoreductase RNF subunit RnfB